MMEGGLKSVSLIKGLFISFSENVKLENQVPFDFLISGLLKLDTVFDQVC